MTLLGNPLLKSSALPTPPASPFGETFLVPIFSVLTAGLSLPRGMLILETHVPVLRSESQASSPSFPSVTWVPCHLYFLFPVPSSLCWGGGSRPGPPLSVAFLKVVASICKPWWPCSGKAAGSAEHRLQKENRGLSPRAPRDPQWPLLVAALRADRASLRRRHGD